MIWIGIGIALIAALVMLIVIILPRRLVRPDLGPDGLERRRLQNEIVRTTVEVLAAAFFLVTAAFAWLEIQNSQRQIENGQRQLEVAREAQITERLTRAVDQLGNAKPEVRLGGIYALERIARDSPEDHGPIMETLAAFLRERASVPRIATAEPLPAARGVRAPVDTQAAVTVLGRRNVASESPGRQGCDRLGGPDFTCVLTLERVDLTGVDLSGGDFDNVDFSGARLAGGDYSFTSLRGADLSSTDLRFANLRLADVANTSFNFSKFESTNFHLAKGLTCEQIKSALDDGEGAVNLTIRCPG